MKLKLAVLCALGFAAVNASACYTVFDKNNRIIYRGDKAPVDMSLQIHQSLDRRVPGASMVFDQQAACTADPMAQVQQPATRSVPVNSIQRSGPSASDALNGGLVPTSTAPLLTDRRTAERMNLPHTVVAGEVVMVPPQDAGRANRPVVTVVPAVAVARSVSPTATLGAGPARSAPAQEVTITEMRNGQTYIQRN